MPDNTDDTNVTHVKAKHIAELETHNDQLIDEVIGLEMKLGLLRRVIVLADPITLKTITDTLESVAQSNPRVDKAARALLRDLAEQATKETRPNQTALIPSKPATDCDDQAPPASQKTQRPTLKLVSTNKHGTEGDEATD